LSWALDHPADIERLVVMDIIPTREMWRRMDADLARGTWHWLFHLQPDLPELLAGANPGAYIRYGNADTYEEAWIYDDELIRIGAPTSRRYLQDGAWRRDFECGYVSVDPDNRVGQIVRDPDGWRRPGC